MLDASFAHCSSTLLRGEKGEKHKIVQIAVFLIIFVTDSSCGKSRYVRLMNDIGQVYCALLVNKSRIVRLKFISVPRLELTGVALSIKKSKILDLKIGYHVFGEVYWTENQVVLGYINSDFCQCKVFLENRVQRIPDDTSTKQWHYVEICNNPADGPSRGLDSKVKKEIKRWFDGLLFF